MKTNSGFDFLAPVYDSLARFVFGKSIIESQTFFLEKIPADSKILILGGGTGWLLEELQKRQPSCTVWYIEISQSMVEQAGQRKLKGGVHFIQGTEESIPADQKFDVVITNFYLDLFSEKALTNVIQRINPHTAISSTWLITDFVDSGKWWQKFLLKIMYWFFKVVCRIDANRLPEWNSQLQNQGWKQTNVKFWYGDFIKSTVWNRE